jgi:hypothetical protein
MGLPVAVGSPIVGYPIDKGQAPSTGLVCRAPPCRPATSAPVADVCSQIAIATQGHLDLMTAAVPHAVGHQLTEQQLEVAGRLLGYTRKEVTGDLSRSRNGLRIPGQLESL